MPGVLQLGKALLKRGGGRPSSTTSIQGRKAAQTRTATPRCDPDSTTRERARELRDTNREWPFLDPPNTAVITNVRILDREDWVHYVTHDEEDGAWQFHPSRGQAAMKEAAVVSLKRMAELDPRIEELADLPVGWHAWPERASAPWMRAPNRAS